MCPMCLKDFSLQPKIWKADKWKDLLHRYRLLLKNLLSVNKDSMYTFKHLFNFINMKSLITLWLIIFRKKKKNGISFYLKKSLILKKKFKDFRKKTLILHYVPLYPSIPLLPYTHSNKHYHQVWQEQKRQKFSSTTICKPGSFNSVGHCKRRPLKSGRTSSRSPQRPPSGIWR